LVGFLQKVIVGGERRRDFKNIKKKIKIKNKNKNKK
jgi:hypothetical protein